MLRTQNPLKTTLPMQNFKTGNINIRYISRHDAIIVGEKLVKL